jgi:ATP-dependent DNA helicase PIF1
MKASNIESSFEDVIAGNNVLITGQGGSGKSTLIQSIDSMMGDTTLFLAPTGQAARNIKGYTCHSQFKMPYHTTVFHEEDMKNMTSIKALLKGGIERIVIDEVGMLTSSSLHFIDVVLRKATGKKKPFGGIQMCLFGDFLQLESIINTNEIHKYFERYGYPEAFCYPHWEDAEFREHNLTKVFRQNDPEYLDFLSKLRLGTLCDYDLDYINQFVMPNIGHKPSICTTNKTSDRINGNALAKLKGFSRRYKASQKGSVKDKPFPEIIDLKMGAEVIVCVNAPTDHSNKKSARTNALLVPDDQPKYNNGTRATVVDMQPDYLMLENKELGRFKLEACTFYNKVRVYDQTFGGFKDKTLGEYKQIPVKLAYATTVHKAQGMTLTSAHIDFEYKCFATAQAYVALSRLTDTSGLSLERPLRMDDIKVNKRAVDYLLHGKVKRRYEVV